MKATITYEQKGRIRKGLNAVLLSLFLVIISIFISSIIYIVYAQKDYPEETLNLIYGISLLIVCILSIGSIVGYIICVASGEKNFVVAFLLTILSFGISLIYSIVVMATGKVIAALPVISTVLDATQVFFVMLAFRNIGRSCHKDNKLNTINITIYLILAVVIMVVSILLEVLEFPETSHTLEILSVVILICLMVDPLLFLGSLIQAERRLKYNLVAHNEPKKPVQQKKEGK